MHVVDAEVVRFLLTHGVRLFTAVVFILTGQIIREGKEVPHTAETRHPALGPRDPREDIFIH